MAEENKSNGKWFMEFSNSSNGGIIVSVYHACDDGNVSPANSYTDTDSSSIAICEYACIHCKQKTTLNGKIIYAAGDILK